jgi:glycosyltransferase involved in cell wall biosynthesis
MSAPRRQRITGLELSVVLPCLNEERTVGACVRSAKAFLRQAKIRGEVIVADNGSTDGSRRSAVANGAKVVAVPERGYGSALRGGIRAARGQYIIMADADESYDLRNLAPFLERLRQGYDLVMGNRFRGGIAKGAMPWHHRYIGNPLLSLAGKLFFRTPANDFHCGLRGFSKEAVERMRLHTTGMEMASEIVIKASILKMRVCEVPTTLSPDNRGRRPHLRSFRDGWRHLRFLLIYSPRWLLAYPGAFLVTAGTVLSTVLFMGPVEVGYRLIDFHSFFLTGTMLMLGLNMLAFSAVTRVYAYNAGLLPARPGFYALFRYFNLEKGLAVGALILLLGIVLIGYAAVLSQAPGFSIIGFNRSVRLVYGGSVAVMASGQIVLTSFVLSILGLDVSK